MQLLPHFCPSRVSVSLSAVLLHNAIPFIGFGFLDNAIMIAAVSGRGASHYLSVKVWRLISGVFVSRERRSSCL